MNKEFFFKVYDIYHDYWGREDNWITRQQKGRDALQEIISKSPRIAFIRMLHRMREQTGSVLEPSMISRDLAMMSNALLNEKLRVKTDPMRYSVLVPNWNCLRYPDMMTDKELARRVLAILAW